MKASTKRGLGKGLGALLSPVVQEVKSDESVLEVKLSEISANPYQPRQEFDPDKLKELAESIRQFGVVQPVVLRKVSKGYELVSGERRCRASKLAGKKTVPGVIREYTNQEMSEIALVENLQRDDLNPLEEAIAYKKLTEEFKYTQEKLADRLGKSRPAVANMMRLLQLPPAVQRFLRDRKLTPGQVRPLLTIQDEKIQTALAIRIVDEGLSARQVEEMMKRRPSVASPTKEEDVHVADMEDQISSALGTKVSIKAKRSGNGTIEISYYSLDDLERLLEIFLESQKKKSPAKKPFVL